jgi:nucleoside-diphosphate-sugar epimerase
MKALVTGGLGYVGSVLCSELAERGIQVRNVDADYYGRLSGGTHPGSEFIHADIRDTETISKYLDDVDGVVHLAAIVGDSAGNLDPEATIAINSAATSALAAECAKRRVKLVFASTSSVYGYNGHELLEESAKTVPLSVYASCKLAAEEAIMKLLPEDSVVFRLGTLYGLSPRMRFDLVVNRFIGQAIQDGRITVFGGSQLRPFLHVRGAARFIAEALLSERAGLYNLGGTNYTILEVAEMISNLSGCEVKVYDEIKDLRNYAVDSAKAVAAFGPLETPSIEFAFDEVSKAYQGGEIKDYGERKYNNEELLRQRG